MDNGRRRGVVVAAAIAVAVAAAWMAVSSTHFWVWYHLRSAMRAEAEGARLGGQAWRPPPAIALLGWQSPHQRCEYHLNKLVELGAASRLTYRLDNVLKGTELESHFTRRWGLNGPPALLTLGGTYDSTSHWRRDARYDLTVWCWQEDAAAWDRFVQEHDVPDYRERFMTDGSPEFLRFDREH